MTCGTCKFHFSTFDTCSLTQGIVFSDDKKCGSWECKTKHQLDSEAKRNGK